MRGIDTLNQWAETWSGFVVSGLIDSAVILAIVTVLWLLVRKKVSVQFGYWLFMLVLLKPLVPFEITVPIWMSYISPSHIVKQAVFRAQDETLPIREIKNEIQQTYPTFIRTESDMTLSPSLGKSVTVLDFAKSSQTTVDYQIQAPPFILQTKLMLSWAAFVLFLLAWFGWKQWKTRRIFSRSTRIDPNALPVDFQSLKEAAGVRKIVEILINDSIPSPAISGILHPKLILPANLPYTLTPNQWTWILLHELAHVRRYDLLASLFQRLVQIVFFYNPAIWIANWAANQLREYACDDTALSTCNTPRRDCGEGFITLVERAQKLIAPVPSALGLFNPGSLIRQRLLRILDTRRKISRKLSWSAAACLVLLAAVVLPIVRAEQTPSSSPLVSEPDMGKYVLTGTVQEYEKNKPIENATITLIKLLDIQIPGVEDEQIISDTKTNVSGHFRIDDIPAGVYKFTIYARGRLEYRPRGSIGVVHPHERIFLDRNHPTQDVLVTMHPGYAIQVNVIDENKQPLQGATVFPYISKMSYPAPPQKTNEKGECFFDTLLNEQGRVLVQHEKYGEAVSEVFLAEAIDRSPQIAVQMFQSSSISGRVTTTDDTPIQGMPLYATPNAYNQLLLPIEVEKHKAVTDANGFYQFHHLGKGNYIISNYDRNDDQNTVIYNYVKDEITLDAGEYRREVNFTTSIVPTDGIVKGRVLTPDGKAVPDARIELMVINTALPKGYRGGVILQKFGQTNENGEFLIKNFSVPENVEIEVSAKGYLRNKQEYTQFDKPIEIVMQPAGSIRGKVIDLDTQEPISSALVRIKRDRYTESLPSSYSYNDLYTYTGNDGTFVLESVNAVPVQLITEAAGYITANELNYKVQSGDNIGPITITLKRGTKISGIVRDSDGNPIANAEIGLRSKSINPNVNVINASARVEYRDTVHSNTDGSYEIDGIPSDGDFLVIQHPDFAPKYLEIIPAMLNGEDLPIALNQGGILEGIVLKPNGDPEQDELIYINNFPENSFTYDTRTNEKGEYRFTKLPAIEFQVRKGTIMANDSTSYEMRPVTIVEEKTIRADFGTGEGAIISGTVYKKSKPERNVQVTVMSDYGRFGDSMNLTTESDENGHYSLKGIPNGKWLLQTWKGGDTEQYQHIEIDPNQNEYRFELGLNPYQINLTVLDAETGKPISDRIISAALNQDRPQSYSIMIHEKTNQDGKAQIVPISDGIQDLQIWREGYQAQIIQVEFKPLNPGETGREQNVEVKLEKAQREMEVRLTLDGEPFILERVRFSTSINRRLFPLTSKPDSENPNRYILTGLPSESFILYAHAGNDKFNYIAVSSPMTVSDNQRPVVLLSLMRTKYYQIQLNTKNGKRISEKFAKIEFLDYPELNSLYEKKWIRPNGVTFNAPIGDHPIRLLVPGYKTIDLIPEELTGSSEEHPNSSTLIQQTLEKEN